MSTETKVVIVRQIAANLPRVPLDLVDSIAEDILSGMEAAGLAFDKMGATELPYIRRSRRVTPGQPCAGGCGRAIRPAKMKAAECPGTVYAVGAHRCSGCYTEFKWRKEFDQ